MTQPNQTLPDADFFLEVEDFILSASVDSSHQNTAEENEIKLYLLALLNQQKKREMK